MCGDTGGKLVKINEKTGGSGPMLGGVAGKMPFFRDVHAANCTWMHGIEFSVLVGRDLVEPWGCSLWSKEQRYAG